MRIVFLGTGGSLPTPKRNVSAVAVQTGSEIILFDCGEGTQRQFMRSSASFMKVHTVFITHLHGDHFLGIPALVQSMSFSGREKELFVFGPAGTAETVAAMLRLGYFQSGFPVTTQDLEDGDEVDFQHFKVKAVRSTHSVPSLAYVLEEQARPGRFDLDKAKSLGIPTGPSFRRLQEGHSVSVGDRTITPDMVMGPRRPGRKIVISGDTRPSEALIEAAKGADVLVHEATVASGLISDAREYGHSTAAEAAEVARRSEAKRLYLYHLSSRYDEASELEEEARKVFPDSYVAEDLMVVQVDPPKGE